MDICVWPARIYCWYDFSIIYRIHEQTPAIYDILRGDNSCLLTAGAMPPTDAAPGMFPATAAACAAAAACAVAAWRCIWEWHWRRSNAWNRDQNIMLYHRWTSNTLYIWYYLHLALTVVVRPKIEYVSQTYFYPIYRNLLPQKSDREQFSNYNSYFPLKTHKWGLCIWPWSTLCGRVPSNGIFWFWEDKHIQFDRSFFSWQKWCVGGGGGGGYQIPHIEGKPVGQ